MHVPRSCPPSCGYSLPKVLKQCAQAVRILVYAVAVERLDVAAREHLEDVLVAHPSSRVATAGLLLAEHGVAHTGRVQAGHHGACDAPVAIVEGAAQPTQ